jgi:hypothetical protein
MQRMAGLTASLPPGLRLVCHGGLFTWEQGTERFWSTIFFRLSRREATSPAGRMVTQQETDQHWRRRTLEITAESRPVVPSAFISVITLLKKPPQTTSDPHSPSKGPPGCCVLEWDQVSRGLVWFSPLCWRAGETDLKDWHQEVCRHCSLWTTRGR